MGADLYLESITEKAKQEYQRKFEDACRARDEAKTDAEKERLQQEVDKYYHLLFPDDGYFRDSYNSSNLLWQLGLSWWADVLPMLDKQGYLPIRKARVFRQMLLERDIPHRGDDEEYAYFVNKKERLLRLLERSIQTQEKIYCSL